MRNTYIKSSLFSVLTLSLLASLALADGTGSGPSTIEKVTDPEVCARLLNEAIAAKKHWLTIRQYAQNLRDLGVTLSPEVKAILLNDNTIAGRFIEIGVTPRISPYFQVLGKRSQMNLLSADYNGMRESDFKYGKSKTGYVSKERLDHVLDVDQAELEHLYFDPADQDKNHPIDKQRFFVVASTVGTNDQGGAGHAWLGMRFQLETKGPWHTIKMHVRMMDGDVPQQGQALGILGTNLIDAVYRDSQSIEAFMAAMKENIVKDHHGRVEIDSMHFEGPTYEKWTDPLIAIHLLESDMTQTVLLSKQGNFIPPSTVLYKKFPVLHKLNADLSNLAPESVWGEGKASFAQETGIKPEDIVTFNWIPAHRISGEDGKINFETALADIQKLKDLGLPVILTKLMDNNSIKTWSNLFRANTIGIIHDTGMPDGDVATPGTSHISLTGTPHTLEILKPAPAPAVATTK